MSEHLFLDAQYELVMDLQVQHAYYADGYCPQLRVRPSEACMGKLKGWQLLVRPTPLGCRIVGRTPALVPQPAAGEEISFELVALQPEVLSLTAFGSTDANGGGGKVWRYRYAGGSWEAALQVPARHADMIAEIIYADGLPMAGGPLLQLQLQAPTAEWTYYIVTGAQYANELSITENLVGLSTTPAETEALRAVRQRHSGKRVIPLVVQVSLRSQYPPWLLMESGNGLPGTLVSDLPALPRPRPGASPALVLDYSAVLK